MRAAALACATALALAGCAGAPAPVPIAGAPDDIGRLAGEWSGSYEGTDSGRSGSIVFQLAAGADTAFGDVVMIPKHRRESRLPTQDPSVGLPLPRAPAVLSIAFVRARDGAVAGELHPYRDPDCDCMVVTRFHGRLHGDDIRGTYATRRLDRSEVQTGTWKVARRRP